MQLLTDIFSKAIQLNTLFPRNKTMIRKATQKDIIPVMKIWLDTNIHAHSFIPKDYWINNYTRVKELLPQAEIYVYEEKKKLLGFIGLMHNHIAGIFVKETARSKGIGKELIDYAKKKYSVLTLAVYQKNTRAMAFYQRENFIPQEEHLDEETGEKEFIMLWKK